MTAGGRDAHASPDEADELPRRRELRLPSGELAVQLPPADLGEDLTDSRRLGEPQSQEIRAADLEPHVPKALEVVAELGAIVVCEREKRCVRCERIGERNNLCRVGVRLSAGARQCAARR